MILFILVWLGILVFNVTLIGLLIWVAWHFISKFW